MICCFGLVVKLPRGLGFGHCVLRLIVHVKCTVFWVLFSGGLCYFACGFYALC